MMKYDARWFSSQAATWDDDPRRVERARRAANAIAAEVPLDSSWTVLDYGAGTGLLAFALADRVGEILLMDSSEGMVETARKRIAAAGRPGMRAELHDLTAESVIGAETAEDALRRGLVTFLRFTDEHRRSWGLLLRTEAAVVGPAAIAEIEAVRQEQVKLHTALFSAYLPNADPRGLEASAEILLGACERLSVWYVQHDDVKPEEAAEHIMRMMWFGLRGEVARVENH